MRINKGGSFCGKKNKKENKNILFFVFIILIIAFTAKTALEYLYPLKYKEYVFKYSSLYDNLDPYLVFSIIKAERRF